MKYLLIILCILLGGNASAQLFTNSSPGSPGNSSSFKYEQKAYQQLVEQAKARENAYWNSRVQYKGIAPSKIRVEPDPILNQYRVYKGNSAIPSGTVVTNPFTGTTELKSTSWESIFK